MEALIGSTVALLAIAMIVAILARRLRLPYTVGLVLSGLGLALAQSSASLPFTHDIIFDLILPPLLFEAALNLSWVELRRDFPPLLALAVLGTALCAAVVSTGTVLALGWSWPPALAFGALISATDPIAVIALLRESQVKGRMALIIETESLLNDGVAAVLFALALTLIANGGAAPSASEVGAQLLLSAGGGIGIGALAGALGILVAGGTNEHLVETAITAVAAYGSFLAAEHIGASGVLATVTAGLVMGNLGVLATPIEPLALSQTGREFVLTFWEFAAFLANSFVFLMIGLALAGVHVRSLPSLAIVIALAVLGRAASVYPLSLLFARSRWRIPLRQQHFLWWAGLRGALALALALALPPDAPERDHILVAAFGVVAFSVLVQGLTAGLALRWLGLAPKP